LGKRASPFLRLVLGLNDYLPEGAKADPKKLGETVYYVAEKRHRKKKP
jgi:hypothetical protein